MHDVCVCVYTCARVCIGGMSYVKRLGSVIETFEAHFRKIGLVSLVLDIKGKTKPTEEAWQ